MRDLPGRGRRRSIMEEDKTWVVDLACQKPKDLGYAQELWTTRLLAKHIRKHCVEGDTRSCKGWDEGQFPRSCRRIR